jgi:MoaA/NifB/PqqE/SkfB family radical SAM enzyme
MNKFAEKLEREKIFSIHITGGEPFAVPNILEIIENFNRHGIKTSIATNATLLDPNTINLLKNNGVYRITTTLHSSKPDMHDKLTNVQGSFKITLQSIKECLAQDLVVNVNMPISHYNIRDAVETVRLVDSLGIKKIKILYITPLGKAETLKSVLDEEWENMIHELKQYSPNGILIKIQQPEKPKDNHKYCTIYPLKHLNISPDYYVYPCCQLNNRKGMEIGHINELIDGDWTKTLDIFNTRLVNKFNCSSNNIPCIPEDNMDYHNNKYCPLYSRELVDD